MEGEIIIRLVGENGGSSSSSNAENQPDEKQKESSNSAKTATQIIATNAWNNAKSIVKNAAMWGINTHFSLTDDYQSQRDMSLALQTVQMTGSTVGMMAMGIATGNPVAVASGLANTLSLGINAAEANFMQTKKMEQLDSQLSYTRDRSGYSLTDGSTGRNF